MYAIRSYYGCLLLGGTTGRPAGRGFLGGGLGSLGGFAFGSLALQAGAARLAGGTGTVITSYSIHYTKLYDCHRQTRDLSLIALLVCLLLLFLLDYYRHLPVSFAALGLLVLFLGWLPRRAAGLDLLPWLALATALAASGATWAQPPEQQPAGNYIVVLQDDTPGVPLVASEHARAYGLTIAHLYSYALKGYAARIPEARLERLRADPRVAFISEDRPVQMVRRPGGGSGGSTSQTLPTGVKRIAANRNNFV